LKSFEKEAPLSIQVVPPFASLMLQQRELEAHATENDEYFLLDDPKVHGKSKMKKAFCQPGNTEFCPVISILSAFLYHLKPFTVDGKGPDNPSTDKNAITIHRTAENGGDVVFATPAELISAFAKGSLHPGDIKAAASILIVSILEQLSNSIKNDCEASKGAKALKAFEKKKQKPKK
jgi:tyrosyl-tRNA synthetase